MNEATQKMHSETTLSKTPQKRAHVEKNSMLHCKRFSYSSCCSLGALKCSAFSSGTMIPISLVTYYTRSPDIGSISDFFTECSSNADFG